MNREIKYKGLTSNGNWVCGNLIQGKNGACYICSINENPIYKNGDYWYIDSPCYVVTPETIGQFTGLLDKNGTKIFEGDIVTYKRSVGNWTGQFMSTTHKIIFTEEVNAFVMDYGNSYIKLRKHWGYEYEVIGNVFENHDLLQGIL